MAVIVRLDRTTQYSKVSMDRKALQYWATPLEPVIGRRAAPTGWRVVTLVEWRSCDSSTLLLNAGVRRVLCALVETGEHRIFNLLALDQTDHDRRRLVAHLERPLADQRFDPALLGDRDLVADGIGGHDHQRLSGDLRPVLVGELGLKLACARQRPRGLCGRRR